MVVVMKTQNAQRKFSIILTVAILLMVDIAEIAQLCE